MGFLNALTVVLTLALLTAAGVSLYTQLGSDNREKIMHEISASPLDNGGSTMMLIAGLTYTTPAYQHEWIGEDDNKVWLLEDIPYPSSKDFIVLVPFWLVCIGISRLIWQTNWSTAGKVLAIALLFILGTIIVWALVKSFFMYELTKNSESLGIKDEVMAARQRIIDEWNNEGVVMPLLSMLGAFSTLTIKGLFKHD